LPGCLTYTANQNRCTLCAFGFFITSAGTCSTQTDPNCLIFVLNSADCDSCYNGFYVQNGVCLAQNVPQCLFYNTNVNTCSTCDYGFYPVRGICVAQSLPNCMLYNSNENTCAFCNEGFEIVQGLCSTIDFTIPNCSTYDVTNICIGCNSGFYADNGQCFNQNLNNCQTYVPNQNVCAACVAPFVLSNGRCFDSGNVITIPNCIRQSGNTCTFCALGYFGSNDNTACALALENGVSFSFQRNSVTNYISVQFNPNFDLILANSASRLSIFEQAVITSPVPPAGNTYSLSFFLAGSFIESPVGTVTVNFAIETITPASEWILTPGTMPYTYTVRNVGSQRYLQDCCTTGANPVVFTVLSVDDLQSFSS
jgi:hypothetical protein